MYSEWMSLQPTIQNDSGNKSVLQKFPGSGRLVASSVVKDIVGTLGIGEREEQPSKLKTDDEVWWSMEVICYGLGQPFAEHETIRGCVLIYCEWLSALTASPKLCVPRPVQDDPNRYAVKIFSHIYNIFAPRFDSSLDQNKRQALLCHRVLRSIEFIVKDSSVMARGTWESLLKLLLAAADTLLAPPKEKDSVGEQLSQRIVTVTFETWLLACSRHFPVPSLWRTFRDMASNWRHHETVITQWNRVNMALLADLLPTLYGESYPRIRCLSSTESKAVGDLRFRFVNSLGPEKLYQCWFRFLHILSNPVDVCRVDIIGQTPKFLHYVLTSQEVIDPSQVECLQALPSIFFTAMKGIADIVDSFLGVTFEQEDRITLFQGHAPATRSTTVGLSHTQQTRMNRAATVLGPSAHHHLHNPHKLGLRMLPSSGGAAARHSAAAVGTVTSSSLSMGGVKGMINLKSYPPLPSSRPTVDSLLNVVGAWLFDAALCHKTQHKRPGTTSHRTKSFEPDGTASEITPTFSFQQGQAEACAALARVFCSVRTGETIQPVYIARFYLVLRNILSLNESVKGEALSYTFLHLIDLLRLDLRGISVLLPDVLTAVGTILNCHTEASLKFSLHAQIPFVELRKAATSLLLSMVCIPLHHAENETVLDLVTGEKVRTYASMKAEIGETLLNALMAEKDTGNTVLLLGGLSAFVEDIAAYGTQSDQAANIIPVSAACAVKKANRTDASKIVNEQDFEATSGIFGQAASLVCAQLMSSWRSDYTLTIAALEVLLSLGRLKQSAHNSLMCKRTIKWLCDIIVYLCNRPPTHQSRDLNSMIVATYNCISHWLVEHPCLLQDPENLHTVLEVVELGISGSKSQGKSSTAPVLKEDKENTPVSLRVKTAAEALLGCLVEHVDDFPKLSGPEFLYSTLHEGTLPGNPVTTVRKYYALGNATILTFIEDISDRSENIVKPSYLVIRGPFGQQAWLIQMRFGQHDPVTGNDVIPPLPVVCPPAAGKRPRSHVELSSRCFPASVDSIPYNPVDHVLITMEDIEAENKEDTLALAAIMQKVKIAESANLRKSRDRAKERVVHNPRQSARRPRATNHASQARHFLSHHGFLLTDSIQDPSKPQALVSLDEMTSGFDLDLAAIDLLPNRTCDTVHLFYIRAGKTLTPEILETMNDGHVSDPSFLRFMLSLGWPVDVHTHPGWSGSKSRRRTTQSTAAGPGNISPESAFSGAFDGTNAVLYWADVRSEIAVVVPTTKSVAAAKDRASSQSDDSSSEPELPSGAEKPSDHASSADVLQLVVWLERYEDRRAISIPELLAAAGGKFPEKDATSRCLVIYIHPLKTGLLRIAIEQRLGRASPVTPLVDGTVVSRRAVGPLVRNTALNVGNRLRVDGDLSQVPHQKRLLKIQEFISSYEKEMEDTEFSKDPKFFFDLFQS